MNRDELKALLRQDEGLRLRAYQDPQGIWTVGYGDTGPDVVEGLVISLADAERRLDAKCARAVSECRTAFPFFADIDERRQMVLAALAYNMGMTRLLGFKKMIDAIQRRDFDAAANELLCSRYAGQVGSRAVRYADLLRAGITIH